MVEFYGTPCGAMPWNGYRVAGKMFAGGMTMTAALQTSTARRMSAPPRIKWTREQYYELDRLGFFEDKHVEFIEGEIIVMAAMNAPHISAVALVERKLEAAFGPEF